MTTSTSRGTLRQRVFSALWSARLRPILERVPVVRRIYYGWMRRHSFDRTNGFDTSGHLETAAHAHKDVNASEVVPYAGSQPSIVRLALASLPDIAGRVFIDLGCGKGRPLLVASEFPFRRLIGVELSPELVDIARSNARIVAERYPARPAIDVSVGDATRVVLPEAEIVCFMYHPFGRTLVGTLLATLGRQLAESGRHAFLVYYNPVHGDVVDGSPHFERWRTMAVSYAPEELGFGPDLSDTVVIWQSRPVRYPAQAGAERRIVADVVHGRAALS